MDIDSIKDILLDYLYDKIDVGIYRYVPINDMSNIYPLKIKKHYVTANRLEPGGIKMDLGRFSVFLYETERLPLHTSDEPRPLH